VFPHVRRPRLLLAAVLLAASVPIAATAPASAAEASCPEGETSCIIVKIVSTVDGKDTVKSYTVTDDQLAAWKPDVVNRQYYTREKPKTDAKEGPLLAQGTSLHHLLASVDNDDPELDLAAEPVTFSETPNASKIPAVLSDADLVDPKNPGEDEYPFDDSLPPAVYALGGKIGYIRPLRDSRTDVNAADVFAVTGPMILTFHTTGKLLEPVVNTSAGTAIKTRTKTTFSVSFAKKAGTRITYTAWDLGDGRRSAREKPTRAYKKQGTYPVVATVRGANGSYGRSAPLEIKVDRPPKKPKSSTGGTGTGSGTGGGGFDGGTDGYIPPYDPGVGSLPSDDFSGDVPDDDLPPAEEETAPVDDGLEPVEGYVLAGAEIAPGGTAEQIPGTQDSSEATPAAQESTRQKIATWTIAALAAALLLAAGATSETRWFRNQLRHLRRRA
jgi:hypothetical protein